MTYSNGSYNPNPLANPFNTRLGPANYTLNPAGDSYKPNIYRSDANAELPEPIMLRQLSNDLHVPDTTPPLSFRQFQAIIDQYSRDKTWDDRCSYLDVLNNTLDCNQSISRKDAEYWNKANIESAKLSANMSEEQRKMLADVEHMFPPSKLEEVEY